MESCKIVQNRAKPCKTVQNRAAYAYTAIYTYEAVPTNMRGISQAVATKNRTKVLYTEGSISTNIKVVIIIKTLEVTYE